MTSGKALVRCGELKMEFLVNFLRKNQKFRQTFISQWHVKSFSVSVREHSNSSDSQFSACFHHSNCDFSSIRDQNFVDRLQLNILLGRVGADEELPVNSPKWSLQKMGQYITSVDWMKFHLPQYAEHIFNANCQCHLLVKTFFYVIPTIFLRNSTWHHFICALP